MPKSHIEPFQILKYEPGQKFSPHYDFLFENEYHEAGNRKYTCLIYLNNINSDDLGGSTGFPRLGFEVRPSLGSAVFWANLDKTNLPDYETLHGGNPPEKSTKYVITAWIREHPFPW